MKKCLVCGRKVVSKRKDAIYCRNPRCRKKAFLARREQAETTPPSSSLNRASVVVTFPDGTKWLLELTPLQPSVQMPLPTLTQVASVVEAAMEGPVGVKSVPIESAPATSKNGSEQIPIAIFDEMDAEGTLDGETTDAEAAADTSATKNCSETVPSVVADDPSATEPVSDSVAATADRPLHASDSEQEAVPAAVEVPTAVVEIPREPALRTVELYFVNGLGQRMTFDSATIYRAGRWRVDHIARAMLGFGPMEGRGLGGQPGRWLEYYPQKSPSECGFVDNIGVLCWEDGERRAYATEAGLLVAAFGVGWSERIRVFVGGRIETRSDGIP